MNETNPKLVGLSALYRGLSDADRAEALSLLSSMRYAPHLAALPDVFSIVPPQATRDQADNIVRGLLERISENLTGDVATGDYDDAYMDASIVGDNGNQSKSTVSLPFPILATVSLVRGPFGGTVPADLVGALNLPGSFDQVGKYVSSPDKPNTMSGDVSYDLPLEGGLFDKLKKVASGAAKVVSAVKNSPLGGLATKVLKVVPGVGSIVSGIEMASQFLPGAGGAAKQTAKASKPLLKAAALTAASSALNDAAKKEINKFGDVPAKTILSNPDMLIEALDSTFGPNAVNDAMFQILAAEGDFIDDVMSGTALSGPALSTFTPGLEGAIEGDWTEQAKSLLQQSVDAFQGMADRTKQAGSSAFSKLDPKVQTFLNNNWGKLAGGTAGVAGTAALYYGVSKYMKEKDAQARLRVLQAKTAQAEKAAAAQRKSLEDSRKKRSASAARPQTTPGQSVVLPPIDDTTLPSMGVPSSPSDGPSAGEVTSGYIKVPFAGTVLSDLAGSGKELFEKWRNSLLSVNPALLTGDLPRASYDDFGAIFLLHGFPIGSVNVISRDDLPQLEDELAKGHPLTSPYLTRKIISTAMQLIDPRAAHDAILIKKDRTFVPWTETAFVLDKAPLAKLRKHKYSRHLSARMKRALEDDAMSASEANHCLNAIKAVSGDYSLD